MAAADVVSGVMAVVMAGAVAGGFFYWRSEQARAADRAYEAEIDRMFENKLEAVDLDFVMPALADRRGAARLEALRVLYADPAQSERLNLGFATARGDLRTSYGALAEQSGRGSEQGRFRAELEERFGEGAYALMETNYRQFLTDAPRIAAERDAQREREFREGARALQDYARRHGRYPAGAYHIENGRVVED